MAMIIDCDGHFTPKLSSDERSIQEWLDDYHSRKQGKYSDAETRYKELDILGVDLQIQNPMGISLGLSYDIDPYLAPTIMQSYNDAMHVVVRDFPRLVPNLWLALQDPIACQEEIYRNLDRDFFAVYVSDFPAWGFMRSLDGLWNLLEKERITWYMHFTEGDAYLPVDAEYENIYRGLLSKSNNNKWLVGVASLIQSGLLDRHPELKIVLAERDINWIDQLNDLLDMDCISYLKQNFWFTIEPEMPWFGAMAKRLGYDRLLFATDWPHDGDIGGANRFSDVETVGFLDIDPVDREKIFSTNYQYLARP